MLRMFIDLHETNSNVIEWYLKLLIVFGNLDCVFELNDLVWAWTDQKSTRCYSPWCAGSGLQPV